MKILSIETSTGHGSVAVLENQKVLFELTSKESKSHSELVHSFIEKGLDEVRWKISEVDLFATTIGPGSFTGIRVSINSAKSFAFVFNKPTIGVDSLTNLAHLNSSLLGLAESKSSSVITCMINAYKNMIYLAQFSWLENKITCLIPPTVVRVQDLGSVISQPTIIVGDGFLAYEKYFSAEVKKIAHRPNHLSDFPTASVTGQMAFNFWNNKSPDSTYEWNLISPLYLRASEAEENKKGIKYTPL